MMQTTRNGTANKAAVRSSLRSPANRVMPTTSSAWMAPRISTPRTPLAYTRTPVSYMTPDEDSSNIPRSYSDHVAVMRPERSTARMLSRTGNTAPIYAGSNEIMKVIIARSL